MNSLRNLKLKIKYDSDQDNILENFYIPVLEHSVSYKRIAGFFSSTSLSVAARGISGLLKNGGKMQLITSSYLKKNDLEMIKNHVMTKEEVLSKNIMQDIENLLDALQKDHVRALGWMLQNNLLEIKIIDILDSNNNIIDGETLAKNGMFHMKVGIFSDGKDQISFSGSVNESATGWIHSVEEFKVFKSWEKGQQEFVDADILEFEKYWNNFGKRTRTYDLPFAIRNQLIRIAPNNIDELKLDPIQKSNNIKPHVTEQKFIPRIHQIDAIEAWKSNDYQGILSMATGSGKTITALLAADLASKSVITIVTVPTVPLVNQWESEIRKFDENAAIILAGTSKSNWKELLGPKLAPYRLGADTSNSDRRTFVICTNSTASTTDFIEIWKDIPSDKIQIIADEVHHLGADNLQNIFKINATRRLGLSATPDRQWDDEGNQSVLNYFKKTVYDYDITQAIRDGYLAHYTYHPLFASMNNDEFEQYHSLTKEIGVEFAIHKEKEKKTGTFLPLSPHHKLLLEQRAMIKKKTESKVSVFEQCCRNLKQNQVLVFCEDTEQMDELRQVLSSLSKKYVIYKSDMNDSQKLSALEFFKNGQMELILAIRCLDEGLDVPDCSACIIVSSSTSIREFVQRRGRVLRMTNTSKVANVYDIIVIPPEEISGDRTDTAESMIHSEMKRVEIMADSSDNHIEVINEIRAKLHYLDMDIGL